MTSPPPAANRVLLLHGIWNARAWLRPLAARLRREGFVPEVFGYASVFGGPEVAVPRLVARLRDSEPVAVLGHSLGGLIALEALRRSPGLPKIVWPISSSVMIGISASLVGRPHEAVGWPRARGETATQTGPGRGRSRLGPP